MGHMTLEDAVEEILDNLIFGNDDQVMRSSQPITALIGGNNKEDTDICTQQTILALQNRQNTFKDRKASMQVSIILIQHY